MNSGLVFQDKDLPKHVLPFKERLSSSTHGKKVIVISGPTASGKTELSLRLAQLIHGEIISADSMQIYRGMDIGTAKAKKQKRLDIPHHLIDVCEVTESFNVVDYYHCAVEIIREIHERGNFPIVVGGTGFYLHSLIYGPPKGPPSSPEVRKKLEEDIEKFGIEALYEKLREIDPHYALSISRGDKQKIIRALEIITLTRKQVSEFPNLRKEKKPKEFDFRAWFIYYPKEILYPRIEMRCDQMIAEGLEQEVRDLEKRGLRENSSAAQAIGYRQFLEYLDSAQSGEDWERFVWVFKQASRRYAKRQFTWFRKEPLFRWINRDIYDDETVLNLILQDLG